MTTTLARRVVLFGDFNCPWSYLASRRAALLAADGVEIDWRAVEHDVAQGRAGSERLGALLEEMQQVLTLLLPGEELPYALAGFAPHTSAAVAAYAEAYRAGAAELVRRVLFEALWLHAFDLADPSVVHTVIVDAVRSGAAVDGPHATWEYGTGITHQVGATTHRLLDEWAGEWRAAADGTVPTLVVGGEVFRGVEAVTWLGAALVRRGLLADETRQPAQAPTTQAS